VGGRQFERCELVGRCVGGTYVVRRLLVRIELGRQNVVGKQLGRPSVVWADMVWPNVDRTNVDVRWLV
jgi:hypothetical protein